MSHFLDKYKAQWILFYFCLFYSFFFIQNQLLAEKCVWCPNHIQYNTYYPMYSSSCLCRYNMDLAMEAYHGRYFFWFVQARVYNCTTFIYFIKDIGNVLVWWRRGDMYSVTQIVHMCRPAAQNVHTRFAERAFYGVKMHANHKIKYRTISH